MYGRNGLRTVLRDRPLYSSQAYPNPKRVSISIVTPPCLTCVALAPLHSVTMSSKELTVSKSHFGSGRRRLQTIAHHGCSGSTGEVSQGVTTTIWHVFHCGVC